jgi:hypothetical protein
MANLPSQLQECTARQKDRLGEGIFNGFSPLNAELNPICHLLALLGVHSNLHVSRVRVNHLTSNGHFSGRTAPLTSRLYILYIYSTDIRTEYFKHAAHSPFFLFKMSFIS